MLWKKYLKYVMVVFLVLFLVELVLRTAFGFRDTVLMQESENYEYIAQANQSRYRFGNHISYNTLSMRSVEVDSTATKILCFGDSVINGGVLTDQDSLATTILSKSFSKLHGKNIQFLNISAGSWGPDNCYAYLIEKGDFNAELILLFVNSHDAYDNMDFEKVVDSLPSFPSRQYSLGTYELWDRYLLPRVMYFLKKDKKNASDDLGINKKKKDSQFNSGIGDFIAYSERNNIPLIVYLHSEKSELAQGAYNEQGQKIIALLKENDVTLITDLDSGLALSDFNDVIHLNEKGQKNIVMNISRAIKAKRFAFLNE